VDIPETKQRPDIYFEKNGERFIIEFQCSPIATEYLERHELYQLAKINDIWILGTEKYNIIPYENCAKHYGRVKTIEKNTYYYFDAFEKRLYIKSTIIREKLQYNLLCITEIIKYNFDDIVISDGSIVIKDEIVKEYITEDNNLYEKNKEQIIKSQKEATDKRNKRDLIIKNTIKMLESQNIKFEISYREGISFYYKWAIDIELKYKNYIFPYVFFIKEDSIDFCEVNYSKPKYRNLDSYKSINISNVDIRKFVYSKISDYNSLMQTIIKCKDCGEFFKLSLGEMLFFDNKSLYYPKRCKKCRDKRKL
jgi:hypothetical protein